MPVFFKDPCHTNPDADKKLAGFISYSSIHLFLKCLNSSASVQVIMHHSENTNQDNHLNLYY